MEDDYTTLIRPVEGRLLRAIWRVVRHPQDAEDALQEALERVWARRERIRRHPNPAALILRLGLNVANDVVRRRARRAKYEKHAANPSRQVPAVSESLEAEELYTEIVRALGSLSRNQAEAILLRFAAEETYANIAAALGCSESAARTHIERGRARLAKLLSHLNTHREVS